MKVRTKVSAAIIAACILCILATAAVLAHRTTLLFGNEMRTQATNQLKAVREAKQSELASYFDFIGQQLTALADSTMTEEAVDAFSQAYRLYDREVRTDRASRRALQDYYTETFGQVYKAHNDTNANARSNLAALAPATRSLQQAYISGSPHPLGEKDKLVATNDGSTYDQVHQHYHPNYQRYAETFGYQDILLVDANGRIVYSVAKEIDFGTSLFAGPYATSGMGDAFLAAIDANAGQISFIDYRPYFPSYDEPASFIATPVIAKDEIVGVLIFKLPIQRLSGVISAQGHWQSAGFGQTGEMFLVGPDNVLRTESRYLHANKDQYLQQLTQNGVKPELLRRIAFTGTAAGQQPIESRSVTRALNGQSGSLQETSYTGDSVYTAYAPIEVFGTRWALVNQINQDEALAQVSTMETTILTATVVTSSLLIVMTIVVGYVLGGSIAKPLMAITARIKTIAENKDLTQRLPDEGNDETARLGQSLNAMFASFQQVIQEASQASNLLGKASDDIDHDMVSMRDSVNGQVRHTHQVASAATEMASSVTNVAQYADKASAASDDITQAVHHGTQIGDDLVTQIRNLSASMSAATATMGRLSQQSEEIGTVLDVIQAVAEQTNLLALNAAIEAARAGEQGRGFSVVAEEVRTLANRTQESTESIREKIAALRQETQSAVSDMDATNQTVEQCVNYCQQNNAALIDIANMVTEINEMTSHIATATQQQTQVTQEISESITDIAQSAESVSQKTQDTVETVVSLGQRSQRLANTIDHFTTEATY
ncbi:hypothetical protein BZJ19_04535 [Salinivibrio proteolyticus]|uniref:methyl-accepting chemotaxis protein n=1 Tax=Salinivibrio proteolyticus TaxID=334715 RepID=UPI0009897DB6|nr:methyl-accepting chemotaxis protein [Salinivibrio proteolyticus]OOF26402.1 hypothetical protein BZJ19_04535 [Salinivibrio proteolyticus]